ncbi:MAG: hypothetical protein IKM61_09225 [Eubacteriaceae bacterium]|nr:hypothetical protein [Eubacteriaceae bacterium]
MKKYSPSQNLYVDLHKKIRKIIYLFLSLNMLLFTVFGNCAVDGVNLRILFIILSVLFLFLAYSSKKTDLTMAGNISDAVIWMIITICVGHFFDFQFMYVVFIIEIVILVGILVNDDHVKHVLRKYNSRK